MNYTSEIKEGENGTIDIIAELATEDFAKYRGEAVQALSENVEVKGFRKGNVPEDVVEKEVGEQAILDEMAQHAISVLYPEMLKKHEIDAMGRPQVSITKIAADNPLGFNITTNVMPTVEIAEYKKIAKNEAGNAESIEVTDEEVTNSIEQLRKMRAQNDAAANKKQDAEGEEAASTESSDEPKDEGANDDSKEKTEEELPELDDEFVKTLGDFKDVADFKVKLKENLKAEKANQAVEKKRIAIMDAIIDKSEVTVPQMLVDHEINKMMGQMEHDVSMSGMKFDEYLEKIDKTKEDLKKDWQETAEKRAKMHLVINKIAAEEKIEPSDEEIEAETQKVMEQYKDVKGIDENSARLYVAGILTNQKVFEFLESQGE